MTMRALLSVLATAGLVAAVCAAERAAATAPPPVANSYPREARLAVDGALEGYGDGVAAINALTRARTAAVREGAQWVQPGYGYPDPDTPLRQ